MKEIEKIMSTTEIGESIVLIEVEKNTYIRGKHGLKRIHSVPLFVKKINSHRHHQSQA